MNTTRYFKWLALAILFAVLTARGLAVVAVTLTRADLYERSRDVVIGEVVEADTKARVIKLKSIDRPKGGASGDVRSLNFADGVEWPDAKCGGPTIVFVGRKATAIHVADGWLVANAPAAPSLGGRWEILGGTMLVVEGNGLPDFYGSGREFGAVINGRGFGSFLSNYSAKRVFGPKGLVWGELTRKTVSGAADLRGHKCEDVLIANEDGRLFEVNNRDVKAYY